jgi:hypothetical protein
VAVRFNGVWKPIRYGIPGQIHSSICTDCNAGKRLRGVFACYISAKKRAEEECLAIARKLGQEEAAQYGLQFSFERNRR